jgi:acetyltransferase-like isoleucine patch superfamily enzyme
MMIRLHELWVRFITKSFTVLARRSFGSFGAGSVIRPPASIHGQDRIHIGSGVYIGPGSWLLALADRPGERAGFIRIGDGSSFSGGLTVTSLAGVCIGKKVLIGRNVHISDHAHRHDMPDMPVIDQGLTPPRQVVIGHGSWIGQGVVICPGVNIGRNTVIGANSVVRADVPDHCLAAGIPARVIRRLPAAATMKPSIA